MPACPRCSKQVYLTEQVIGPKGVFYHKMCLTCKECNKRLESSTLCEHEGEVFCKSCHGKAFGPKGYGFSNGAAFLASEGLSSNYTTSSSQQSKSAVSKSGSNHSLEASSVFSTGQRFSAGSGNPICPVCIKSVFFAEQVIGPGNLKYHKACFKCTDCRRALDSNLCEREGKIYCNNCYGKKFGPKVYGFGGSHANLDVVSK